MSTEGKFRNFYEFNNLMVLPNFIDSDAEDVNGIYKQILTRAELIAKRDNEEFQQESYIFLGEGQLKGLKDDCQALGIKIDDKYLYPVRKTSLNERRKDDGQIEKEAHVEIAHYALLPIEYVLSLIPENDPDEKIVSMFRNRFSEELRSMITTWYGELQLADRKHNKGLPVSNSLPLEDSRLILRAQFDATVRLSQIARERGKCLFELDPENNIPEFWTIETIKGEQKQIPEEASRMPFSTSVESFQEVV